MLICELIEKLRRFPQNARVGVGKAEIMVDVRPMSNRHGKSILDALCETSDLPDELRERLNVDMLGHSD